MILRFQQTRLKHYIICWDRLNSCYPEEFSKLIGCCQFNWRRILSWHTKRSNIIDKVNSRGRYKKRVKMISSLCQNNMAGRLEEGNQIEQNDIFVQKRVGATGWCTIKHIYYTLIGTENLERFLRICMSLRRQSKHMENGIWLSFRAVCATIILKLSAIQDTNAT